MAKVEALTCPVCGGQVDLEEGAQRGQCLSCRASLALPLPMGFAHYYVQPLVRRNAALTIAAMATDLAVEPIAANLYFVPVWSAKAETFAFIAGQRPVRTTVIPRLDEQMGMGEELGDKDPHRERLSGGEVVKKGLWLAQEFREFGVRWSNLGGLTADAVLGQPQQPLAEGSLTDLGARLEPHDLPPERALAEAERFFAGHILYLYKEYPILKSSVANLRIERRLVYYPVWCLWGFTKKGRFQCTVDAVTGDRIAARQRQKAAPPHPTSSLLGALGLALLLSMLYAPTSGYNREVFGGVVALAAAVAAGIGLKKYLIDRFVEKACRAIWGM
ncbi:MAG TPA: hypothetical protein VMF29_06875 [Candidatus Edwardsbacteria bacterium]|nr:hypothetical protein [Candidatus Edwardsbacteria bacterium]